jgi:hypothetical protein
LCAFFVCHDLRWRGVNQMPYERLIATALLTLLAGCASPLIYSRSGATQQDFARDRYACVQESRTESAVVRNPSHTLMFMAAAQHQADQLFRMCMEGRGYDVTVARP